MRARYDFSHLIHPITWETFIDEYHEKKPLVIKRGKPNYFAEILTIDGINEHLGNADLIYPGIRLVKDANEVSPASYTYTVTTTPRKSTDGVVDKEKLFAHFYSGHTIILNSHERHSLDVLHLRHVVERAFGAKAQANIYLTPFGSQGFTPHWDTHDVFILQVGGSKEWRIYDSPIKLPSKNQLFAGLWEPTLPQMIVTLHQGDLLYIPRGYVHDATAARQDISLHITLGIKSYTNGDLLRILLGTIDDTLFFRESVPIGFGLDRDRFIEQVASYVSTEKVDKALAEIQTFFACNRLADPSDRLRDYLKSSTLSSTTQLRKRPSTFYDTRADDTYVTLRFNNKAVKLPRFMKDSIDFIVATEQFSVGQVPGSIDDASKIVLCRKLVDEGFLTLSS